VLEQQQMVRGFLASVGLTPEILVEFQYNPTSLTDKRSVTYATLTAPGQLMPDRQYSSGGDRSISFTVRVDALGEQPGQRTAAIATDESGGITPELNKYRAFMYPANGRWQEAGASFVRRPGIYVGAQFVSPPACRFGFGDGRVLDVVVTEISITELQFNNLLAPMRADVAISLVELGPYGDEL
jgi:hypothetical protein